MSYCNKDNFICQETYSKFNEKYVTRTQFYNQSSNLKGAYKLKTLELNFIRYGDLLYLQILTSCS